MCALPPNLPKAGEELENFTIRLGNKKPPSVRQTPPIRGRWHEVPEGERWCAAPEGENFAFIRNFRVPASSLPHPLRGSPLAEGAFYCFSFKPGLVSSSKLRFCVKNLW